MKYAELVRRIQDGVLTSEEAKQAFRPDAPDASSFSPRFALDETAVDITGIERAARASATELAYQASLSVRTVRFGALAAAMDAMAAPARPLLAEGDSWFNLPDLPLVPPTLVDDLAASYSIANIAHWGDTLEEVVASGEATSRLAKGQFDYFLISAGGNDVLGGGHLQDFIRQRTSGDNDVNNAPLYIQENYYQRAAEIERVYGGFVRQAAKVSPKTKIFIHGYDYCLPRQGGHWLGEPLRFRGFDPFGNRDMARAIIRVLVDDFNTRLKRLALSIPNVVHVDLRNTVQEGDWWDELHPGDAAAQRLAALFKAAIGGGPAQPMAIVAGLQGLAAQAPAPKRGASRRRSTGKPS